MVVLAVCMRVCEGGGGGAGWSAVGESLSATLLPGLPSIPPMYAGQEPSDKVVDQMMAEAPGPLNFTMFLTLFGEKLNGW